MIAPLEIRVADTVARESLAEAATSLQALILELPRILCRLRHANGSDKAIWWLRAANTNRAHQAARRLRLTQGAS